VLARQALHCSIQTSIPLPFFFFISGYFGDSVLLFAQAGLDCDPIYIYHLSWMSDTCHQIQLLVEMIVSHHHPMSHQQTAQIILFLKFNIRFKNR
jgi:hypothetical protein